MRTMFSFVLICLFAFSTAPLFAQEQEQDYIFNTWQAAKDESRYIFADTAMVRIGPDTKQAAIDTLLAGDDVVITDILTKNMFTLKGITAPWIQIKYKKDGIDKEGYVWEGLISFSPMRRGDLKFVYAYDRRVDTLIENRKQFQYLVKLKVVQARQVLAVTSFKIFDGEGASFSYPKVMPALGLTNVQNIVTLSFGGEACGVATDYYYFAWMKDGRLVALPGRTEVGDAGAYYHGEAFIFPGEKNGQPDTIILRIHDEEATEKMDKNGEPIMSVKEISEKYSWDGVNGTFKKMGK